MLRSDISMPPFSFCIEAVSFLCPGHTRFKLKVSLARNCEKIVHPGILSEIIVVLPTKQRLRVWIVVLRQLLQ